MPPGRKERGGTWRASREHELTAEESHTRRNQILAAALEVIGERGFPDTRVADVAERAEVSVGLIIYYFKTKDHLLAEAMRSAEKRWYDEEARRTSRIKSASKRLEELVAMTFLPDAVNDTAESWSTWLDLWAAAVRQPEIRRIREESEEHWRETVRTIVHEGQQSGEFGDLDVDAFVVAFTAVLDGLAIQVALEDAAVPPLRAFELTMSMAASQLGFAWGAKPRRRGGL